ncbi:hypothetical protein Tco_1182415 [Tanacetum coccineum]
MEISATVAATAPFVTSSVTLTPEREGGGHIDSVSEPNFGLSTQLRGLSPIPPPPVMIVAIATTVVFGTSSAHVLRAGTEPAIQSLFADFASPRAAKPDTAGPSDHRGTEISANNFYICHSMIDQLAPPRFFSQLRGMDYDQLFAEFNVGVAHQTCLSTNLLKEKDVEIASLKAQLSLKEAEAAEAIRLCNQFSVAKVAEATRVSELDSLKERNTALEAEKSTLEGEVAALESVVVIKDTELASFNAQITKLTQDLIAVVTEYLVKLDQKARILELKRRYFEDYYSDNQYAVSIKEETVYSCLHSPKTTKDHMINTPYPEDQYVILEISMVNILEDIKRGPYSKKPQYAVSNTLDTPFDETKETSNETKGLKRKARLLQNMEDLKILKDLLIQIEDIEDNIKS